MESDDDGGEHTNAIYYERFWTKPAKIRIEWKGAKVKLILRHQEGHVPGKTIRKGVADPVRVSNRKRRLP